ncbi:MAG: element excision factor XisH family protein, partial [Gemmatimonadales bacterium]
MPARDAYHDLVRNALIKDGWVITHDPLRLRWGRFGLYVDLGAERAIGPEQRVRQIAV